MCDERIDSERLLKDALTNINCGIQLLSQIVTGAVDVSQFDNLPDLCHNLDNVMRRVKSIEKHFILSHRVSELINREAHMLNILEPIVLMKYEIFQAENKENRDYYFIKS